MLGERLGGSTAKTAELFREQEAQVGVFTLLGKGAEDYKQNLDELIVAEKEATATTIAANKQFDTLDARLKAIGVTIEKEVIVAFDKISPSVNAALDSLEDIGVSGGALNFVLDMLAGLLAISVEAWLLFKGGIEAAGFWIFKALAGISALAEKIPILNKFLGASASLTARFTEIQKNFAESWRKSNEDWLSGYGRRSRRCTITPPESRIRFGEQLWTSPSPGSSMVSSPGACFRKHLKPDSDSVIKGDDEKHTQDEYQEDHLEGVDE
ncbi:hypothetical protein LCGC14_2535170, partial [marine sediment metagenome]